MPDGQTAAAGRPAATTLPGKPQGQQTGAGEPATNGQASSVADSAAQPPASSPAPSSDNPALGIQLADNVQLPAVIIALSDPNKDPEHKTPPPVAAAMQRIVDSFYQELANSARENSNAPITDADGQQTLLIQPGPAVERARANANESYRVLFGDEAYNRLTMNSLLEARLSKDPGPK